MKITRNKKLDVAYVQFRRGSVAKTVQLRRDVLLDLDQKGQILGIEVLSLSALKVTSQSAKHKSAPRKRAA